MKCLLPWVFVVTLALAGCGVAEQEVRVQDVTRNETLILHKAPGQGSVTGITITGRGSITGRSKVQLILNGAVYKQAELDGDVSIRWGGDWYADTAEIRYQAGTASQGTLTLTYGFHDL